MKNPYIFGYLPFVTIVLFSLTFGVFSVGASIDLFKEIGLYAGLIEFLSDVQLRFFLLVVYALLFFMFFSALKLIAETIHEIAMLFFSKDSNGESYSSAKGGNVIYFFGALLSIIGLQSIQIISVIFFLTTFIYFIYAVYKLSRFMTLPNTLGLVIFEIIVWGVLVSVVLYIILKLYNGIIASLPIIGAPL
jgi:hypothetical protein